MSLEPTIGTDEFILDINGMDAFINDKFPSKEGEDVCE